MRRKLLLNHVFQMKSKQQKPRDTIVEMRRKLLLNLKVDAMLALAKLGRIQ